MPHLTTQLAIETMFTIRQPANPDELQQHYDLRWRVLREPWNQPRGSEQDEFEAIAAHASAYDAAGRLIGVGRLHGDGHGKAQIRYMAIEEEARGRGAGRAIVEHLEQIARRQGISSITLHARADVVGFYLRLGYQVTGAGPTLFGTIEHSNMSKHLDASWE